MDTSKRNLSTENLVSNSQLKRSRRDGNASETPAFPECGAGEASESERRGSACPSQEPDPGSAFLDTEPAAGGRITTPPQNPKKNKKKKYRTLRRPQGRTTHTKITQGAINNAKDADPNQGRCLLENTEDSVQAAHIIRRSTDHGLLRVLEQSWKMSAGSFHADTRCNVMFLNGSRHIGFDQDKWMLLPDPNMVNLLYGLYSKKETIPIHSIEKLYKSAKFTYYIVPHRDYKFSFTRSTSAVWEESITQTYRYPTVENHPAPSPLPCSALGPLKSHVHPHCAIINAALKFRKNAEQFDILGIMKDQKGQNIKSEDGAQLLEYRVRRLYEIWTAGYDGQALDTDDYLERSGGDGPSGSRDKRPRKSHFQGSYAGPPDFLPDDGLDDRDDNDGNGDNDNDWNGSDGPESGEGSSDYDDEEEDNLGMTPDRGTTCPSTTFPELSPIHPALLYALKPHLPERLESLEGPEGSSMDVSLTEDSSEDPEVSSVAEPRSLEGLHISYAAPCVADWVKASACPLEERKASMDEDLETQKRDEKLRQYAMEPAQKAPFSVNWHKWFPPWLRRGDRDMHKPDPYTITDTFTSNDWAFLLRDCQVWR